MKFIKYNSEPAGSVVTASAPASSGGGTRNESGRRLLWGNDDDGSDIMEDIFVDGSLYVGGAGSDSNEPEYDENGKPVGRTGRTFETRSGDDGGNVFVDGTVESSSVRFDFNGAKRDLETDQKRQDTDISANATRIGNLETRHAEEIAGITSRLSSDEADIASNRERILNLENGGQMSEERVLEILDKWKYGSYTRPVVLMSGQLIRNTLNGKFQFSGQHLDCWTNDIPCSVDLGMLVMELGVDTSRFNGVQVTSVSVMQGMTSKTSDVTQGQVIGRGIGFHWFECSWTTDYQRAHTFRIREIHQGNGDNDTACTNDWTNIQRVNIIVTGYATPLE